MATYNKYQDFVEQVLKAVHNFDAAGHTYKLYLSNVAPTATDTGKPGTATEIAAGNGYTAGGEDVQNTLAEAAGTATVTGTKIVWTCVTAAMAAFRYLVLYNDSATSPADALVAWWDYGSSLTLYPGDTFTVKFNNGDPTGTIFTLA